MADPRRSEELAARIEERRRMLEDRPDVSQRLRDLSASNSRNAIPSSAFKRRSPLVTLAVTLGALLALVACVVGAVAVISSGIWVQAQLGSPNTTVQDFYAAVHSQDYPQAYGFLSSQAQKEITLVEFQQSYVTTDTLSGAVESYAITTSTTRNGTATVTVDVVRRGDTDTATIYVLTLTQQNNAWRIAAIRQTGTGPAPTPSS